MGDRNNPIKFGPEWLRNLPSERGAGGSSPQNNTRPGTSQSIRSIGSQGPSGTATNPVGVIGTGGGTVTSAPPISTSPPEAGSTASGGRSTPTPGTSSGTNTRNTNSNPVPKVLLANMRYGREEMLALYDRTSEAPEELKQFDILYQSRGKQPVALNTFEEEIRDNIRGGPPIAAMSTERFAVGRGAGRGAIPTEPRGKSRLPFVRHPSSSLSGRGSASMHTASVRLPGFSSGSTDEDASAGRPWSANNGGPQARVDQGEWGQNKMFRRRHPSNTNWRQTSRDEGDEWRHQENSRPPNRPNADNKWDRDWSERQDRPQSWTSSRRPWMGDTQNNEDNLPEWAVDSAEAGAGSFDSSGAFHGYSNDDTSLPKNQETTYPLARSQTHGSFARSKTADEGSYEWWASEKAKKLSPKRFDTGDTKFKKSLSTGSNEVAAGATKINANTDDLQLIPSKLEKEKDNNNVNSTDESKQNALRQKFSESKTFDALMRSDFTDSTDDRGNFQSVMITPNNGLRQKHQNIVTSCADPSILQSSSSGLLHILHGIPRSAKNAENESSQTPEEKIVEELIDMTLDDTSVPPPNHQSSTNNSMPVHPMSNTNSGLPLHFQTPGMQTNTLGLNTGSLPTSALQTPNIQNIGIRNSALNSSLGLPIGPPGNNGMVLPLPLPPTMQNSQIGAIQSRIGSFQPNSGISVTPTPNVANSSLFLGQNNPTQMPSSSTDLALSNLGPQSSMFPPIHGVPHTNTQGYSSIYGNIMPPVPQNASNAPNLAEQWYYEDPKKIIQGPFTSSEMYTWYRAGFFSLSLMVRRACDTHMRPLGSYGPIVPFTQLDVLSPFLMSGFESRPQGHELLNSQPSLGIEDSLWGQPGPSQDLLWMQQTIGTRNESNVNNLPMFFWDPQPSTISSKSLLPEEIAKEMKTEDEILAQLRAAQNIPTPQAPFLKEATPTTTTSIAMTTADDGLTIVSATPDIEKLQPFMPTETIPLSGATVEKKADKGEAEEKQEKTKSEPANDTTPKPPQIQSKATESKAKQAKNDTEKTTKVKEATKTKNKKTKEDKKEDSDAKNKEDDGKSEKPSTESSPTKTKKEEKQSRKELEKEKKEWIKEGFTIVKGPEKTNNKENKKKAEEIKATEETERKKKEEEKLADDERKKKLADVARKQQQGQQQRQILDTLSKKAPWSATQATTTNKDGLTLAEIQRLEREKKLEQIKEQQHMMQLIAQQQAAALAREQVINDTQANLPWNKKKTTGASGQSLSEIQAETRRQSAQAAVAALATTAAIEEAQALPPPPPSAPWANAPNGGFWDTPPTTTTSSSKSSKTQEPKVEKKKVVTLIPKKEKETTPMAEFETWCGCVLASWSGKIDVPTFVGFLKDIESPYEVKDYVKCYLGDTKEANDFARQFLERRSKILRVGMVTPSDDLCSPAMAVNPRSSLSDYQEVKGKGKKSKKNKMLKVDARILGFSVTASEDRINVGDIDTV